MGTAEAEHDLLERTDMRILRRMMGVKKVGKGTG